MSGVFDPATFLDTTTNAAGSTSMVPCPAGVYPAIAGEPKIRSGVSEKNGKAWAALDVPWDIEDAEVKAKCERDKVIVTQSLFLDLTPAGGLDMSKGKNVSLNRLREAIGKNKAGEDFSPRMIQGAAARVEVKHRPYEGEIFADVKGVAPL